VHHPLSMHRRAFLHTAGSLLATAGLPLHGWTQQRPKVVHPRATDGDDRYEPNWEQKLTVTVGPHKADLVGTSDRVIQAAVDYVARFRGGTVQILPGRYVLRNAIFLPSGIRLRGSGPDSVLTKIASRTVALADDSDWYDQEITLADAAGFEVGDGVVLRAKDSRHGNSIVIKRTLVARSGKRFKLDDGLRKNLWLSGRPTCATLFPLLTSARTSDVVIENLTLDGNGEHNDLLDGNYAGCIFLQDCNRYTIRDVEARNYHGDGISFQICHDVVVERCHCHHNTNLGIHPGSGSQRPLIRHNQIDHNNIGIFWCWGVKYGLAEDNQIDANRSYGISIGHCDTDNVMRNNRITNSGKIGVLFRNATGGRDFWPNGNRVENNLIADSGGENGIAIDITGRPRGVRIAGNQLRESRGPAKRIGIRIGKEVRRVELVENHFQGFARDIVDLR